MKELFEECKKNNKKPFEIYIPDRQKKRMIKVMGEKTFLEWTEDAFLKS